MEPGRREADGLAPKQADRIEGLITSLGAEFRDRMKMKTLAARTCRLICRC